MKNLLIGIVAALAATLPFAGAEPKSGDVVFAKLKQIVIPVIDFEDTTLNEARFDAYITSHGIILCPVGQSPFPSPKGEKGEVWKKLTEQKPEPAAGK